jgi:hypothetical protein
MGQRALLARHEVFRVEIGEQAVDGSNEKNARSRGFWRDGIILAVVCGDGERGMYPKIQIRVCRWFRRAGAIPPGAFLPGQLPVVAVVATTVQVRKESRGGCVEVLRHAAPPIRG